MRAIPNKRAAVAPEDDVSTTAYRRAPDEEQRQRIEENGMTTGRGASP
jgi:hypothetical protein